MESFFSILEKEGIGISITERIQVQRILEGLSTNIHFQDLPAILSPIITKNQKEQAIFHRLWNDTFGDLATFSYDQNNDSENPIYENSNTIISDSKNKFLRIGLIISGFVLILAFLVWAFIPPAKPAAFFAVNSTCFGIGDTFVFSSITSRVAEIPEDYNIQWKIEEKEYSGLMPNHVFAQLGNQQIDLSISKKKFFHNQDSVFSLNIYVGVNGSPDPFDFTISPAYPMIGDTLIFEVILPIDSQLTYRWEIVDSFIYGISTTHIWSEESPTSVRLSVYSPENDSLPSCHAVTNKDILETSDINRDFGTNPPVANSKSPLLIFAYSVIGGLFFILICFLLINYNRIQKIRQKIQKLKAYRDSPPFDIPFKNQQESKEIKQNLSNLASEMRKRRIDGAPYLDIEKSISATINQFGFPQLIWNNHLHIPEYLIFIERNGKENHANQLFEKCMQFLREEEVHLELFSFDSGLKTFQAIQPLSKQSDLPYSPPSKTIQDLYHKYPNHQLIIFGQPEMVISSDESDLSSWASKNLSQWNSRIWMTPHNHSKWGYHEAILQNHFHVIHQNLDFLSEILEKEEHMLYQQIEGQ